MQPRLEELTFVKPRPPARGKVKRMHIKDICTREVALVRQDATLQEAARLMREKHVGMLLVVVDDPEGPRVDSLITDRDIVLHAVARGLDAATVPVGRLGSERLVAVPADAALDEAIGLMKDKGVRRLVVAGDDGGLYGVVSHDDILIALGNEVAGLAHALRSGMEREIRQVESLPGSAPPRVPDFAFE